MRDKIQDQVIVVRTIPYGESDIIAGVLGSRVGRISVMAKGARKSAKRFPGGLDIFDCGTAELLPLRGHESLSLIQSFTDRKVWLGLRERFASFGLASLAVELITVLTEEGNPEDGALLPLLVECLSGLDRDRECLLVPHTLCFLLETLQLCGISPLHEGAQFNREIAQRLRSNEASQKENLRQDPIFARQALNSLLDYVQSTHNKKLRTRPLVAKLLAQSALGE